MRITRICANIANDDTDKSKFKTLLRGRIPSGGGQACLPCLPAGRAGRLKIHNLSLGLLRRFAPRNDY